jgi:hypothetical protein
LIRTGVPLEKRDFYTELGGGKLMKDNLFTGFFLNRIARLNFKHHRTPSRRAPEEPLSLPRRSLPRL